MKLAKFYRKPTACLILFGLVACINSPPQADFNRSEAVKARSNLALAYLEQNEFAKAKENIDKALHHDHSDYLPYSVLAYYYQQIGETENASMSYRQALQLSRHQTDDHQPRPDVLNNYGTFLCKQGEISAAYQQFEQALTSRQTYYHQADTLENIAICAYRANDIDKQRQALAQLKQLAPEKAKNIEILQK